MKIPNLVELFPPFLDTTDLIATKPNLEITDCLSQRLSFYIHLYPHIVYQKLSFQSSKLFEE